MADFTCFKCRKYENLELPRTLLVSLNEMRNAREHCDLLLRVEDQIFPAHRVVLAASSSYFRAMFSPSSSFSEAENSVVCLKGVDQRAVREVLDYFYTGKLEFSRLNFEDLLTLANLWDVQFLLSASEDFIRQDLNASNSLGWQFVVHKHQTFPLSFQAYLDNFILNNFMAICNEKEFVLISADRLRDLLVNDLLRVKSEEMVFEAVIKWIEYDRPSRKRFMPELFKEVRFELMPCSYLNNRVLGQDLVQQDSECRSLVLKILQHESPNMDLGLKKRKVDALYIFGGDMNHTEGKKNKMFVVQYLDCAMGNNCLKEFSPIHISGCHVALLSQFIYFNSIANKNLLMRFNMLSLEWENLKGVSLNITSVSNTTDSICCSCQQFMYIIGGTCYRRLSTTTTLWQNLSLPTYEHYRPGVCSFNDKVYAIGGCDRYYYEATNHVERYDTVSKAWEMLSPMPTARWGAGAAVLNNMIYVVGG